MSHASCFRRHARLLERRRRLHAAALGGDHLSPCRGAFDAGYEEALELIEFIRKLERVNNR